MTVINPYTGDGRWYKGNLHTHTKNSDGQLSIDEVVDVYKKNDYNFLAITDHNIFNGSSKYNEDDFVIIPGQEVHIIPEEGEIKNPHIIGLNLTSSIPENGTDIHEQISLINKQNGYAIFAHPRWSYLDFEDVTEANDIVAIEIFNHVCQAMDTLGFSLPFWDRYLTDNKCVWGVAVDDAHQYPRDFCRGWVYVCARELSINDIVKNIIDGNFYASTGNVINAITVESDSKIVIDFEASNIVRFIGKNGEVLQETAGDVLTSAEYVINGNEKYIRAEVVSYCNGTAWTNPLFIE